MKQINKFSKDKIGTLVLVILNLIYGGFLVYLHYNQTFFEIGKPFESDLPFHINMAVVDNWYYSFTAFVYVFLYKLPYSNMLVALFLTICELLTIYGTYLLLKEVWKKYEVKVNSAMTLLSATTLNFVMAFYVKAVNACHYIGYQNATIWHNSTYICMKLLAVFVLWYFLKLMDTYKEKLPVKKWFVFTGLVALSTGIKPSFLMVFAPVMAIMLLIDWLKGAKFSKVFCFGLTVIPSLLIILWQNMVLFGSDTGNSFIIKPFYTLAARSDNPKVALLFSVLFPAIVGIFHIKDVWKDKLYFGSLLVWGFGFLEVFLFVESGTRSKDSNFMWGYSISLFILFLISLVRWVRDLKNKEFLGKIKGIRYAYLITAGATFAYHVVSGLWFFFILLSGATYFS